MTAKEFINLSQKEQDRRKGELSKHEMYLLRTLYSPPGVEVIGHFEMTDEDRKKADADLLHLIKAFEKNRKRV